MTGHHAAGTCAGGGVVDSMLRYDFYSVSIIIATGWNKTLGPVGKRAYLIHKYLSRYFSINLVL